MAEQVSLGCAPNFRDLGGILLDDGRIVQNRRVYRSEAIQMPDTDDVTGLNAFGIRTVIDLRSTAERGAAPGYWSGRDVEVHEIELAADPRRAHALDTLRENQSSDGVRKFMGAGYEAFPSACAPAVRAMFELVAAGKTPLLIHCTAGKDRTGFLIAMLLAGTGAPFEAISRDYLKSGDGISAANIEGSRFAMNHRLHSPLDDDAMRELVGVRDEFLLASMRIIDSEYGSVPDYLYAIGVSPRTVAAAREHLVT